MTEIFYSAFAVLASIGTSGAIILGLSGWLGKLWADRILQNEAATLRLQALTHEIRFGNLHRKQAEVIAEMYSKIIEFAYAAEDYVRSNNPTHNYASIYYEKEQNLFRFYDTNKIYFTPELSAELKSFFDKVRAHAATRSVFGMITKDDHPEDRKEAVEELRRAMREIKTVPALLDQLETRFRTLLGVQ